MAISVEPLRGRLARLPLAGARTWHVLAALIVVQWAAVASLAATVRHNGWTWYQGGDQLWHYSSAWLLAHGVLPVTLVGYLWAVLLAPVAAVAGPNLAAGLPAVVLLDLAVLLPVALLAVYGIAERVAGRTFGLFAAALWIVLPYLGIRYTLEGYHQRYSEIVLPQSLGLTAMSDFPAMVALMVSAYFCLRLLHGDIWIDGAAAGLAAGVSIAIKPSNALFLVAPALLLLAYRLRALPPFVLGLAPFVITLALWKQRGLGEIPALSEPARRVALGATADIIGPVHKYVDLDWTHLNDNRLGIKEHFWSERLVEWSIVAGLLGLLRRSRPAFVLVGAWFVAFVLAKGSYWGATIDSGSFFRLLIPAFPAFVILLASIVLLLPRLRSEPMPRRRPPRRLALASLGAAFALFAVVPLGVVAAVRPLSPASPRAVVLDGILRPLDDELRPTAQRRAHSVRLSWRSPSTAGTRVFFNVLASRAADGGLSCSQRDGASAYCTLTMSTRAIVRGRRFVDRPPPGRWTYRIGVTANWLNDTRQGDIYALSAPIQVLVP